MVSTLGTVALVYAEGDRFSEGAYREGLQLDDKAAHASSLALRRLPRRDLSQCHPKPLYLAVRAVARMDVTARL